MYFSSIFIKIDDIYNTFCFTYERLLPSIGIRQDPKEVIQRLPRDLISGYFRVLGLVYTLFFLRFPVWKNSNEKVAKLEEEILERNVLNVWKKNGTFFTLFKAYVEPFSWTEACSAPRTDYTDTDLRRTTYSTHFTDGLYVKLDALSFVIRLVFFRWLKFDIFSRIFSYFLCRFRYKPNTRLF